MGSVRRGSTRWQPSVVRTWTSHHLHRRGTDSGEEPEVLGVVERKPLRPGRDLDPQILAKRLVDVLRVDLRPARIVVSDAIQFLIAPAQVSGERIVLAIRLPYLPNALATDRCIGRPLDRKLNEREKKSPDRSPRTPASSTNPTRSIM